jgi:hypothetical protein
VHKLYDDYTTQSSELGMTNIRQIYRSNHGMGWVRAFCSFIDSICSVTHPIRLGMMIQGHLRRSTWYGGFLGAMIQLIFVDHDSDGYTMRIFILL